jgi:hypothetical protein
LLKPRRLASKLRALVLVELMLQGRDGIGGTRRSPCS